MTTEDQDIVQSSQNEVKARVQEEDSEMEVLKRKVEELETQLTQTKAQLEDSRSRYKYLQADFENYRKQVVKDNEMIRQRAVEGIVIELISLKEDLDRALEVARHSGETPLLEGLRMISSNLNQQLLMEGVEKIDALGKLFNYEEHEATSFTEDHSKPNNTVTKELRSGYKISGKVIRTSLVEVVRNTEKKIKEDEIV